MDCNSILYDAFRSIVEPEKYDEDEIHDIILEKTTYNIEIYIQKIQPDEILFIAFDGVAPFAKMEQQRNRRYKSEFQTQIQQEIIKDNKNTLSSSMFTPGTKFMQKLSVHMSAAFLGKEKKYGVSKIILATPLDAGEGEHKLYEHLRNTPSSRPVAIYGLDADLIMLSLFHLPYAENIYVFREAPEFMKGALTNECKTTDTDELWGLDIAQLGRSIANEMACKFPDNHRMYDYVFLCFFLGNDFLPHFPALNIRTHGIQRLLDVYRNCIGNKANTFLITKTPFTIHWKEVYTFVFQLAKLEHEFIIQEYEVRKKWDYFANKKTPDKIDNTILEEMMQNAPVIFRQEETYISPSEYGWENRYYSRFFTEYISKGEPISSHHKKEINVNYLEGLEWVFKYYTSGCIDWKWKYKYIYPPLLKDLVSSIPQTKMDFLKVKPKHCFSSYTQLAYVLPKHQLNLLPEKHRNHLMKYYSDLYPEKNYKFKWSFCRYLWESHICLPDIPIDKIESEFSHFTPST
jgi:5'-3' exonuclease